MLCSRALLSQSHPASSKALCVHSHTAAGQKSLHTHPWCSALAADARRPRKRLQPGSCLQDGCAHKEVGSCVMGNVETKLRR